MPCGFFLLSIFYHFCSSPNLSGRRLDVYHTSIHGVALVRMYNAGLKCAVCGRCKCRTQKSRQKSPSGHQRTTLSGYIFATKARIDYRKKLFKQQYLLHVPHNMVNFGLLAAEIVSLVWVTPANFNGFRVLAALLHGTPVVGVSQTLRR